MSGTRILASVRCQAAAAGTSGRPPQVSPRPHRLPDLQRLIFIWVERISVRRDLERKLKHAPHLIDDMGLTRHQAEAEIVKPFWKP